MDPRDVERQEIEAELKRISKLSKDKAIAELRDRLEEIRVQRVQNKLLKKELDEKNVELANEREETARWKARAFSSAQPQTGAPVVPKIDVKKTEEYRKLRAKYLKEKKKNQTQAKNQPKMTEAEIDSDDDTGAAETPPIAAAHLAERQRYEEKEKAMQERITKLEETIAELNETIAQKKTSLELLNRDRDTLQHQVTQMHEHIEQLEKMNTELQDMLAAANQEVQHLRTRALTAEEIAHYSRPAASEKADKAFQAKFGLPDAEFPIESYACANQNLWRGTLYITPHYLCFETTLNLGLSPQRIKIALRDIVSLNKCKGSAFVPGKGFSVLVKTVTGEEYFFKAFTHRKQAVAAIVRHAHALGHKIIQLRNGIEEL